MIIDYFYQTLIIDGDSKAVSKTNCWDEPLRYKTFDTTAEVLASTTNYILGEVVFNKEINAPCVRTDTGWSQFTMTALN